MATINLRDLYPENQIDCFIDVPDSDAEAFVEGMTAEIAAVYFDFKRKETAYRRRAFWNKAHYSLDICDGIENGIIPADSDPVFDSYIEKLTTEQLKSALSGLPQKQSKRIYAKYILGISQVDIARMDGVSESAICKSIALGLKKLEKNLKKFSKKG